MDDDTIREMARRMGGGHPIADIRAEEHVAVHNSIPVPEVIEIDIVLPEEPPVEEVKPEPVKPKAKGK